MLTILANIRVNSTKRLEHLMASCASIDQISDNWLVNIRGSLRQETLAFLRAKLGSRMVEFTLLDEKRGWIRNSLDMLAKARYDYVLFWNEDHVNLVEQGLYGDIVREMSEWKIDFMPYSTWQFGKLRAAFDKLGVLTKHKILDTITLTPEIWEQLLAAGHYYYILNIAAIFKKDFLIKMMIRDDRNWPLWTSKIVYKIITHLTGRKNPRLINERFQKINKFTGFKMGRFSRDCPFDLEKDPWHVSVLPFNLAVPRQELFACIDDDIGISGYSLISRGMYFNLLEKVHSKERYVPASSSVFHNNALAIIHEISGVMLNVNPTQVGGFIKEIKNARIIAGVGAGRMGLSTRTFIMRLGHMGLAAYMLGDTSLPHIGVGDLLIVSSGSGETQSVYDLVKIAHEHGARIALLTCNPESRMGKMADSIVHIKGTSKTSGFGGSDSIQPMTTLNEQSVGILFDAVVLELMKILHETHDSMWARHSHLE